MEKTINVEGKDVKLKSSAAFAKRYKAQFRRDPLADIINLGNSLVDIDLKTVGEDPENVEYEVKEQPNIDLEVFYDVVWALAKNADKTIPEPIEFLDQFESFPIFDNIHDILDLALVSMNATVKPKKK